MTSIRDVISIDGGYIVFNESVFGDVYKVIEWIVYKLKIYME